MKKITLIILFFAFQLSNIYGQWQYYKTFMDCSKPIHPKLVHLKGNVKTINETLKGYHNESNPYRFYAFKNKKIISDSFSFRHEYYFYDKYGYLKETKNRFQTTTFISDSITHQLISVHFGSGKNVYNFTYEYQKEKVIEKLGGNILLEYSINEKGLIVNHSAGRGSMGWVQYEYDEKNNLSQKKEYYVGGICNYVSIFDKYDNLILYDCDKQQEPPKYIYSNIDKQGNWTIGASALPISRFDSKPVYTNRIFTYY